MIYKKFEFTLTVIGRGLTVDEAVADAANDAINLSGDEAVGLIKSTVDDRKLIGQYCTECFYEFKQYTNLERCPKCGKE